MTGHREMCRARTEIKVLGAFDGQTRIKDLESRTGRSATTIGLVLRCMVRDGVVIKPRRGRYELAEL